LKKSGDKHWQGRSPKCVQCNYPKGVCNRLYLHYSSCRFGLSIQQ
jgi:hypothetical protein